MKKLFLVMSFLLLSIIGIAQKHAVNAYLSTTETLSIEYASLFISDENKYYTPQNVGVAISFGHNYEEDNSQVGLGMLSKVDFRPIGFIYGMGIRLYEYGEQDKDIYYGVTATVGAAYKHIHILGKINLITAAAGNFNNEWAQLGIGFSF